MSTAAGTAAWTTAALGAPVTRTLRVPHSAALQGIRDISYDERSGTSS